jgi:hypothetical protein
MTKQVCFTVGQITFLKIKAFFFSDFCANEESVFCHIGVTEKEQQTDPVRIINSMGAIKYPCSVS